MAILTKGVQAVQHHWKKCVDHQRDLMKNKPHLIAFHESIYWVSPIFLHTMN